MRTLAEMLVQVRRQIGDVDSQEYSTDTQLTTILSGAAQHLWDMFLQDARTRHLLLTRQCPQSHLANVDQYPVPSDLRRVAELQYRTGTTKYATLNCGTAGTTIGTWQAVTAGCFAIQIDERLVEVTGLNFSAVSDMAGVATVIQTGLQAASGAAHLVTYDSDNTRLVFTAWNRIGWLETATIASGSTRKDISGSGYINGRYGTGTPSMSATVTGYEWQPVPHISRTEVPLAFRSSVAAVLTTTNYAGTPDAWRMLDQHYVQLLPLSAATDGLWRLVYYRTPVFPTQTYDLFLGLPDGVDSLVEYLATILLQTDKIEDKAATYKPAAFGQYFQSRWETFIQGLGGGVEREPRRVLETVE